MGSRALLSLIAASLSILATAGEAGLDVARNAHLIRGPWWWHGPDGAPCVAIATAGEPERPATMLLEDQPIVVAASVATLADTRDGADHVLTMRLPPGSSGTLRFTVNGEPVHATVSRPLPRNAPVRIALAGGRAWPNRSGLEALGRQLGGPPQAVLALGPDCSRRVGTGGWESELPLAVVAPAEPDLAAATNGQDASWRNGLGLGVLGLPASPERERADLALARDLSPWLVYIDSPAGWDPSIAAHNAGSANAMAVLIAACQRLQVPLILSAGDAGLISEPLALSPGGALGIDPGGVRVAMPLPMPDDTLCGIDDHIALPLEQPLIAGLAADLQYLELVLVRPDAADAIRLRWDHPAPAPPETAVLAKRIAASEDLAAVRDDIARLMWATRAQLATCALPPEAVARLRDEGGAAGRTLARRFVAAVAEDPATVAPPGDPDPQAVRDILMWRISHIRGRAALSWSEAAATSQDAMILRLLLADEARDPARDAHPALVRRVELQASGELPLDPDPLDQQRLFAAVFDDVHASPTTLRPLAVALKDKVSGLGAGPITRFIARHGLVRPP